MKIQPYQIKMIHTLKGALGLDDETYRAVLSGYGVVSSKEMTDRQAAELTRDLTAKAKAAGVWREGRGTARRAPTMIPDDKMSRKILALWIELHKAGIVRTGTDEALLKFVKRLTGKDRLQWCSTADKSAVINALNAMEKQGPKTKEVVG